MLLPEVTGSSATSSTDVSRRNRATLLEHMVEAGAVSRIQLARETGLSPATVNRLVSTLMDQGLVKEAGSDGATGGRPSMLVRFDPDSRRILALDIWEEALDIAVLNLDGEVISRRRQTLEGTTGKEKLAALVNAVAEVSREEGPELVSVGVSVPGPVTATGEVVVAPAVDWYDVPVLGPVQAATPAPVTVENDVNLIAVAEYLNLNPADHQTLVALAVYQGVGSGIVEDGRLWRGNAGAAGQFGRMLRDVTGLQDRRHGFGHLERELGTAALLDRAIKAGLLAEGGETADVVFGAAQAGDANALEFVETIVDEYAFHLVNMCAMIAPDTVVFGGLLERWSDLVLPKLSKRLEQHVLRPPVLQPAELGDDGKLIGAALHSFRRAGGLMSLVEP